VTVTVPGRVVRKVALGIDHQRCEVGRVARTVAPVVGGIVAGGELVVDRPAGCVEVRRIDRAAALVV